MNPSDAVEVEATGQRHVVAVYKGHEYKIPFDADDWPIDLITVSVGVNRAGALVVNSTPLAAASQRLLGTQWPEFLRVFPRRRDLVAASQAFASAAGLPAWDSGDKAFGALPRLLMALNTHPAAVEATLAEQGLDYRDRWRFDADGHRLLTLRRINVLLRHTRPDSPLGIAENDGKMPHTATDLLLMDLFEAITKTAHPSRPMPPEQKAERLVPKDRLSNAADEWRKRNATPRQQQRQTAVATATANAQIRKKAVGAPAS